MRGEEYYDDDYYDDPDDYGDEYDTIPQTRKKPAAKQASRLAKQKSAVTSGVSSKPPSAGSLNKGKSSSDESNSVKIFKNTKSPKTPEQSESSSSRTTEALLKSTQIKLKRKPLSEFKLDQGLLKLCGDVSKLDTGNSGSYKQKLHLVVMGHVDAGKSTLMGRTLYELGYTDNKEIRKNEKESARIGKSSFSWAWVLDERPEERERGVTVDVAQARFSTKKFEVTLLDAPGHRDFVPNMISGTSQADAALLVVDGSLGGFEAGFESSKNEYGSTGGGQTREHAQLARSLGIDQIAIAITKLDYCEYSKERYDFVKGEMLPFLRHCGFKESKMQWLVCCAPRGENITKPLNKNHAASEWYKGPTLLQAIDNFTEIKRNINVPLRLPVGDVFKSRTLGACAVGGKLEGGVLKVGSSVLVAPACQIATVKALEVDGKESVIARAGDSCDIGLGDIDPLVLFPGSVICLPEWSVKIAVKFIMRLVVLDSPIPIIPGSAIDLHSHCTREEGKITQLVSLMDSKTGKVIKSRPRCLTKGNTALVEITPIRPICLEEYADYRALGRVTLRSAGCTIAVGIVTDITEA